MAAFAATTDYVFKHTAAASEQLVPVAAPASAEASMPATTTAAAVSEAPAAALDVQSDVNGSDSSDSNWKLELFQKLCFQLILNITCAILISLDSFKSGYSTVTILFKDFLTSTSWMKKTDYEVHATDEDKFLQDVWYDMMLYSDMLAVYALTVHELQQQIAPENNKVISSNLLVVILGSIVLEGIMAILLKLCTIKCIRFLLLDMPSVVPLSPGFPL